MARAICRRGNWTANRVLHTLAGAIPQYTFLTIVNATPLADELSKASLKFIRGPMTQSLDAVRDKAAVGARWLVVARGNG